MGKTLAWRTIRTLNVIKKNCTMTNIQSERSVYQFATQDTSSILVSGQVSGESVITPTTTTFTITFGMDLSGIITTSSRDGSQPVGQSNEDNRHSKRYSDVIEDFDSKRQNAKTH